MQHRPWKKTRFQSTTLIAVVVLLAIVFTLVGYFFVLPDVERSRHRGALLADLAENRGRWQASEPAAYRYVVERDCYCPDESTEPYIITVDRGAVSAAFISNVEMPASGDALRQPDVIAIEDLFAIATDAASGPRHVDVVFAATFGYPSRITIDDLEGGRGSIETYTVRDFEVIEYD